MLISMLDNHSELHRNKRDASELPEFAAPIGNHTVAVGRDVQFSCKINNLSTFKPAWLRIEDKGILSIHNKLITRNYRIGLINDDNGKNFILTIKNVEPQDKGGYMCQVNSVPMRSQVGYLDVLTPPQFEDTIGDTTATSSPGAEGTSSASAALQSSAVVNVIEGGEATLTCKANGHPKPTISWRREDNEPIHQTTDTTGESLKLKPVSRLHAGAYLCIASNGVVPAASKRQILEVQFGPQLRVMQTQVGVYLGKSSSSATTAPVQQQPSAGLARLVCNVESNPTGTHFWVRQATNSSSSSSSVTPRPVDESEFVQLQADQLRPSDKHDIVIKQLDSERTQMVLHIRQPTRMDLGAYRCVARNSLGTQSGTINLYEVTQQPSSGFSLDTLFRGGSSSNSDQLNDQQQPPDSTSSSGRPQTRSSWQRTGQVRSSEPSTSAGNRSHIFATNSMLLALIVNLCFVLALS